MTETLLIGGNWCSSTDGGTFPVINPASGQTITNIAKATASDAQSALEAAAKAFPVWSKMSARKRAQIMHKAMDIFRANLGEASRLLTLEHGKPLNDSIKECRYSADVIDFYAEESRRIEGTHFAGDLGNTHSFVLKQPLGVVAAITPWNFPVDFLAWKLGPRLAVGCTFVIKPPTEGPLGAAFFVRAFVGGGGPAGGLSTAPAGGAA